MSKSTRAGVKVDKSWSLINADLSKVVLNIGQHSFKFTNAEKITQKRSFPASKNNFQQLRCLKSILIRLICSRILSSRSSPPLHVLRDMPPKFPIKKQRSQSLTPIQPGKAMTASSIQRIRSEKYCSADGVVLRQYHTVYGFFQ